MSQEFNFSKRGLKIPSLKDYPWETDEVFELRMEGITDPISEELERLHRAQILFNAGQSPEKAFRREDPLHNKWSPRRHNIRWKEACRPKVKDSERTGSIGNDRSETGTYIESARAAFVTAFETLSNFFGWTQPGDGYSTI